MKENAAALLLLLVENIKDFGASTELLQLYNKGKSHVDFKNIWCEVQQCIDKNKRFDLKEKSLSG